MAPKTIAFSISPRPQRGDRTASVAHESVGGGVSIYRKTPVARLDAFVGPKDSAVPLNGVDYAA
jgi:hypothetical protein